MYLGMREVLMDRGFDTLEDAGDIGGNHESSFGIDEAATVNRMLQWIDQDKTKVKPFFAVYMPIAGHHPYNTPTAGPYPENDEINRYRSALHYADQSVAELVAGLRARRLESGTVLLIFGDHGEAFGQHDGNFGHTNFIYEENLHVPFLIVIPGLDHQVRVTRPLSLIDVPGTICDLLAIDPPKIWQGGSALRDEGMSLFLTDYSLGLLGLRDGHWKFIYQIESGRATLFNLKDDPTETINLAQTQPQRCEKYRKRLLNWAAAQRNLVLKGK
jgi:arylsulfatase A-like enzyme